MLPKRIIARLDIKGERLIKGIHLEGWRFIGDPNERSRQYYQQGVDELLYIDAVANLYNREKLVDIVKQTSKNIFIPLTAGGGIRSTKDAYELLQAGADKVAVNTGSVKEPRLLTKIARKYGKQCVVSSIQAKKIDQKKWEVYIDTGREPTGLDVIEWAKKVEKLGAGELLLTSIDQDGTQKGFDIELVREVAQNINIPIIASGGYGKPADFVDIIKNGNADAVAIARALHYDQVNIEDLHKIARENSIFLRNI